MSLQRAYVDDSKARTVGRGITLRRFDPRVDSYASLTAMLHRAFARLGAMELNCACVGQSVTSTMQRAQAGDCFVVAYGPTPIGTMTLYARDAESACAYYRLRDVATLRQFGIDPAWQGRGLGTMLLAFAEHWAATRGYAALALDTPYPASHLIAFYRSQGFRFVDVMRFADKCYDSAILSKPPVAARMLGQWDRRLMLARRTLAGAA
ncbi:MULTISPECIES: GNAT family N-acetyltransferase [Burkholderiaceae]|uniref:GNAT family N-acetyltransferase n=1 Tax=Burkholderiaceae TaxID=119060 RepID=UPI000965C441|nr:MULTISPECIES: GNAT family N-acetyltransferase [Burkholderiaceae]MCG1019799.1 GNAT family N-acetyltransferase [Mycetohabitans sp. B4]SIT80064.1 Acetyltransferase (GNAT) family protein [Burkholderia sp. b13]